MTCPVRRAGACSRYSESMHQLDPAETRHAPVRRRFPLMTAFSSWIGAASDRRVRITLFTTFFLVVWGLITHGNYAGTGDEPHYMMIAHSVVFDRDIDLANDYADRSNLIFAGNLQPEAHAIPGVDGTLRPIHDIGMPIALAPAVWFAYTVADKLTPYVPASLLRRARLNPTLILRHLMSFAMMALAGLLVVQLFDLFRESSGNPTRAFLWSLLLGLSPPLLSHSFLFFTETLSALLVVVVFRAQPPTRATLRHLLLGVLIGYLVLVHARNAGLALGLFVLVAAKSVSPVRGRPLLALATGFAAAIAVRTCVNEYFWGSWVVGPHARTMAWKGSTAEILGIWHRLWGWTFDQEHGLLWVAPHLSSRGPGLGAAMETRAAQGG